MWGLEGFADNIGFVACEIMTPGRVLFDVLLDTFLLSRRMNRSRSAHKVASGSPALTLIVCQEVQASAFEESDFLT